MRIVLQEMDTKDGEPVITELGIVVSRVIPRTGEMIRYKDRTYYVDETTHVFSDDDPSSVFVVCDLIPDLEGG